MFQQDTGEANTLKAHLLKALSLFHFKEQNGMRTTFRLKPCSLSWDILELTASHLVLIFDLHVQSKSLKHLLSLWWMNEWVLRRKELHDSSLKHLRARLNGKPKAFHNCLCSLKNQFSSLEHRRSIMLLCSVKALLVSFKIYSVPGFAVRCS